MKRIFLLSIILFGVVSCTPTDRAIQRAIALTQEAATAYSPTQDSRVIEIGPEELLLNENEISIDAEYYLESSSDKSRFSNSDVIADWGDKLGSSYIQETGRIDGWVAQYQIKYPIDGMPVLLIHNVIQFSTVNGAIISLNHRPQENIDFALIDDSYDLGNISYVTRVERYYDEGDIVAYKVTTVFQNYTSIIIGIGIVDDLDINNILDIAEQALEKLENAPLVNK